MTTRTCPHCLFCLRRPAGLICNDAESFSYQKAVDRDWRCRNFVQSGDAKK